MRLPKLPKDAMVVVDWVDSGTRATHWDELTVPSVHGCRTVGFVFAQGRDSLTLVFTKDTSQPGVVLGDITIPLVNYFYQEKLQS